MITKPKGTYDILPSESKKWARLEGIIRRICDLYNYKEIRTPIFESYNVFHRDLNDTSDMVTKETYDFKDRSNRDLTLRPEGTAGVARAFIENKLYADNKVNKLFYMGSMFRYERPQKGRNREFHQFGIEALGSDSPLIDAEVIALGASLLRALGIKNVKVKINSIGDLESRMKYKDVLKSYFNNHLNDLCPDCLNRLEKNPLRILDCKVDKDKDFFKAAPKINDYLNEESKNRFNEVLEILTNMELEYEIDYNLVRGLDYYSHTVFELEAQIEELGSGNVIGAGGRYDNLIKDLDGPDVKGVGMAFGMERLLYVTDLAGKKLDKDDELHAYIIALGDAAQKEALRLLNIFRIGGLTADMDYSFGSLKSQFKKADANGAKFTLILGDNELKDFKINIKDNLFDTQETIGIYEAYPYIINKLNKLSACGSCNKKGEN